MSVPLDPNHALLIGNVWGALHEMEGIPGIVSTVVAPETVEGSYTNRFFITRGEGKYVVSVEKVDEFPDPA